MVWLQKIMDGSHGTSGNRSKHYVFILDSGAEEHCTGDKSLLSDYRDEVLPGRCLRGASGKEVRVHGTGSIYNEYFQVKGVLYIPDLNYEENISTIILSVGKLCEHNLSVHLNCDGTGSVINNSKLTRNLKHEIVGEARIAHGRFMLDYLRTSPIRVRPGLASLLVWSSTNGRLSQRTACLQRLPDVSERDAVVAARLDAAIEGEQAVLAAVVKERTSDGVKGKGNVVKVDQLRVERTKAVVEAPRVTTAAMVQAVAESTSRSTNYLISLEPNRRIKRTITSWQKGEHLGSGSFGSVYEAISEDGFFFAVKEVSLVDEDRTLKLEHEISLLSRWEHENIVQYFGTDKKDGKLYIFLELVTQGSLAALYKKYRLQDSQVSAYTRQILNGLDYLHQQNVLHRDIKCANILVDASGLVKLADFGLAKEISTSQAESCKGTVYWMAPEVAKAKPHGPPADIWSLGCTVLEMLTRKVPYPDMEWIAAFHKIGSGIPPEIPNTLSEDAHDFIKRCVQANPNDRPSAAQLFEHPFVQRPLQQYGP